MTKKSLTGHQIRWYKRMAEYDLRIVHRPGCMNLADAPSRRPDYEGGEKPPTETLKWFREAMCERVALAAQPL